MIVRLLIYTDGGSRGNPGRAAYGGGVYVESGQLDVALHATIRACTARGADGVDGPDDAGELVWRGIFLAFEVGSEAEHDIGHRLS